MLYFQSINCESSIQIPFSNNKLEIYPEENRLVQFEIQILRSSWNVKVCYFAYAL
jgi:hypothetical protein